MTIIQSIQNRIHEIRGHRVMLDFDLAELYEVETRVLNQAVKRNIKRFPSDFMFRLTKEEMQDLQPRKKEDLTSQVVISNWGGTRKLPYAFTEQGVAMLSGVLNSEKAINMNITIMRAFVAIRRLALSQSDIVTQLQKLKQRIGEHDMHLSSIYDAIENLLDEKVQQNKWESRERIGFRQQHP
jgi:hypothetical protein